MLKFARTLPLPRTSLVLLSIVVPLCLILLGVPSTAAVAQWQGGRQLQDLPCLDAESGNLLKLNDREQAIEDGVCIDAAESVWFYKLTTAPICSNGLQEGAPTHVHLWWGSIGNPVEDAFDPENYGLYVEGGLATLTLEFSPHFIYNESAAIVPQPLFTTELAIAPANILLPLPCESDINEERGENICAGWTSLFGDTKNKIVVAAPDGLFGRRALDVGVKFFHLHPTFGTGSHVFGNSSDKTSMFNNANGTCTGETTGAVADNRNSELGQPMYCLFDHHCPNNNSCVPVPDDEPLEAYVTATLLDAEGNIKHKGKQYYVFDKTPQYRIHNSNTGLAGRELVEVVDFQRVPPGFGIVNVSKDDTDFFNSSNPYAPRFYLFGPTSSDIAFPQTSIANLTAELVSSSSLTIYEHKHNESKTEIGSCQLVQPQGAGATILDHDNLGYTRDGPARFGGTIMSVPIQVGAIPGNYQVACQVIGGDSATCTIIVESDEDRNQDGTNPSGAWGMHGMNSLSIWRYTCMPVLFVLLANLMG